MLNQLLRFWPLPSLVTSKLFQIPSFFKLFIHRQIWPKFHTITLRGFLCILVTSEWFMLLWSMTNKQKYVSGSDPRLVFSWRWGCRLLCCQQSWHTSFFNSYMKANIYVKGQRARGKMKGFSGQNLLRCDIIWTCWGGGGGGWLWYHFSSNWICFCSYSQIWYLSKSKVIEDNPPYLTRGVGRLNHKILFAKVTVPCSFGNITRYVKAKIIKSKSAIFHLF